MTINNLKNISSDSSSTNNPTIEAVDFVVTILDNLNNYYKNNSLKNETITVCYKIIIFFSLIKICDSRKMIHQILSK